MKNKISFLALVIITFLGGCASSSKEKKQTNSAPYELDKSAGQAYVEDNMSKPNVLQVAIKSEDHSTLVAAVQAAGLENSLVNAGPLMVFAPINSAFDKLPEGTVESLLKPENKDQLSNILLYHVTPGNYKKDFLKNFKKLGQANDQSVLVEVRGDDVYIGGAKVIASVEASNGIVHVVDAVILPAAE